MELPSPEVAALALLLSTGDHIGPGDHFAIGWQPPDATLGALPRYIAATPELLDQARALVDAWRDNAAA